ncbi:hypothetical protein DVK06_12135 [Halorubrum sp. Atlit-28R]|nr:hypothetical protein DVK06_12135 [Halorubrum sp. Atlit-28R]
MTDEPDASDSQAERHRTSGFHSQADAVRSDGGTASGRERHRILRELRGELARHPAVLSVAGEPPNAYRELQAELDPSWFGRSGATASLRLTWIPDPSVESADADRTSDEWVRTPIRAYYTVHYSEPSGFDCGFHCEPNPHIEGLLHYQERDEPADPYTYEPVSFDAQSVSGLLWELMDALGELLHPTRSRLTPFAP